MEKSFQFLSSKISLQMLWAVLGKEFLNPAGKP